MKASSMSSAQRDILKYLKRCRILNDDFHSPTSIGRACGMSNPSAWTSPKILRLVRQGVVERTRFGHYRFKL